MSIARNRKVRQAATLTSLLVATALIVISPAGAAAPSVANVLNGTYRVTWSEKELLAAGASRAYVSSNFGYLQGRHGGITIKLHTGQFQLRETLLPHFLCSGTYAVTKNVVSIKLTTGCYGGITAQWSIQNRLLRLRVSRSSDPGDKFLFGGKPWKKIA